MSKLWYAIRVRSNFEQVAATYLKSVGYDAFSPTYEERRRGSDRMRRVDVPLFNGYAFCKFSASDRLPILKAPGVVNIVGFGKEFIPIPGDEIEAVRAIATSYVQARPWPYLTVGEPVRIARGPLTGVEGILVDVKTKHRLIVSVHLLQRSVAAEVSLACVERSPRRGAPPYYSERLNPSP